MKRKPPGNRPTRENPEWKQETFANAQLWKNLLRETCTMLVWSGERDGHTVDVWGNM